MGRNVQEVPIRLNDRVVISKEAFRKHLELTEEEYQTAVGRLLKDKIILFVKE